MGKVKVRSLCQRALQVKRSVFPLCFLIAAPCAALSGLLQQLYLSGAFTWGIDDPLIPQAQAWSGFTFLVGFLIVFRTSQSYSRWWEGCSATFHMRAEFMDASTSLMAFCKVGTAPAMDILKFKHLFVRLLSLMHATALAEVEEVADDDADRALPANLYDVIDPNGIDEESLELLRHCPCKVDLIMLWIQQLVTENISTGVLAISAPILSRVFQELANGMVHYHTARKLTTTPFPFAYAQVCDILLLIHWVTCPVVMSQWVSTPAWAGILTFAQVFILWSLEKIATGIENPFGTDAMDLDGELMQEELNVFLRTFLDPRASVTPSLRPDHEGALDASVHVCGSVHAVLRGDGEHDGEGAAVEPEPSERPRGGRRRLSAACTRPLRSATHAPHAQASERPRGRRRDEAEDQGSAQGRSADASPPAAGGREPAAAAAPAARLAASECCATYSFDGRRMRGGMSLQPKDVEVLDDVDVTVTVEERGPPPPRSALRPPSPARSMAPAVSFADGLEGAFAGGLEGAGTFENGCSFDKEPAGRPPEARGAARQGAAAPGAAPGRQREVRQTQSVGPLLFST